MNVAHRVAIDRYSGEPAYRDAWRDFPTRTPPVPDYKAQVGTVTGNWRRLRNLDEGREHPRTAYDMRGHAPETPLHATGSNAAINRWGVPIEDRAAKRRNEDYARHYFARFFAEEGGMQMDMTSTASDKPFAGITSTTLNDMKAKYGKTDPELARLPAVPQRLNESQVAKFYGVYAKDVLENAGGISGLQTIGDLKTQDAVLDTLFVLGRSGGARMTREAIRATVEKLPPAERQRLGLDGFAPRGPFDGEALRAVKVLQGEGYGRLFRALLGDLRDNYRLNGERVFSPDRVIRFR